jgi:hypothetical protein
MHSFDMGKQKGGACRHITHDTQKDTRTRGGRGCWRRRRGGATHVTKQVTLLTDSRVPSTRETERACVVVAHGIPSESLLKKGERGGSSACQNPGGRAGAEVRTRGTRRCKTAAHLFGALAEGLALFKRKDGRSRVIATVASHDEITLGVTERD